MRRSIVLLLKLVENNMFRFMARVEGLYELLVKGIERLQSHLNLSPFLGKCFTHKSLTTHYAKLFNSKNVFNHSREIS